MRIEFYANTKEQLAAVAEFAAKLAESAPTRAELDKMNASETASLLGPVQAPPVVDAAVSVPTTAALPNEPPKKGRKKAEAAPAATEQAPAPAPEAAAQDVRDEAPAAPAADATIDDVRAALGVYVKKFGLPAAQADGPKLLGELFGEGCKKVSDIPNTPAAYAKAVAAVNEMVEKNPNKREAV